MPTSASGNDLNRAAAVSDQIRHITRQAFLMQLHATNAMVRTRSRGVRVPGFEVVADQMRQLSRELVACLDELSTATARWLEEMCRRAADERSLVTLALAARMSRRSERAVEPVLAAVRGRAQSGGARSSSHRRFLAVLDDARQLAATGCILARTAKLEATYGAELAVQLAESAAAFTELADSVDGSVRTIARRLTDESWSTP